MGFLTLHSLFYCFCIDYISIRANVSMRQPVAGNKPNESRIYKNSDDRGSSSRHDVPTPHVRWIIRSTARTYTCRLSASFFGGMKNGMETNTGKEGQFLQW